MKFITLFSSGHLRMPTPTQVRLVIFFLCVLLYRLIAKINQQPGITQVDQVQITCHLCIIRKWITLKRKQVGSNWVNKLTVKLSHSYICKYVIGWAHRAVLFGLLKGLDPKKPSPLSSSNPSPSPTSSGVIVSGQK